MVFTRNTRNRDREKSWSQAHLFNIFNNRSHWRNLRSTPGHTVPNAQYFFEILLLVHGNHRPYRIWKIKWKAAQDFSLFMSFIMLITVLVFAIISAEAKEIFTRPVQHRHCWKNTNIIQRIYSLLAILCSVICHCSALSVPHFIDLSPTHCPYLYNLHTWIRPFLM